MAFFDSHLHLTDEKLFSTFPQLLERAKARRVDRFLNICCDLSALEKGVIMRQNHPEVLLAAAVHPHSAHEDSSLFFQRIEELVGKKQLAAVGESGLDAFYGRDSLALQKKSLEKHLLLAKKFDLPLVIHCRDAFEELIALGDSYYGRESESWRKVVLHCFTGSEREAMALIERGAMLSFSGIITFKKSEELRTIVGQVPFDQLLIETDSPYLAPVPYRGSLNEPSFLVETAFVIATKRGVSVDYIAAITYENGRKLFGFF